jgi:hypothetical protein
MIPTAICWLAIIATAHQGYWFACAIWIVFGGAAHVAGALLTIAIARLRA